MRGVFTTVKFLRNEIFKNITTAAYDNWTKEQAIEEFQQDNLGYHYKMYPNLLVLLKNLDVEKMKNQLKINL